MIGIYIKFLNSFNAWHKTLISKFFIIKNEKKYIKIKNKDKYLFLIRFFKINFEFFFRKLNLAKLDNSKVEQNLENQV